MRNKNTAPASHEEGEDLNPWGTEFWCFCLYPAPRIYPMLGVYNAKLPRQGRAGNEKSQLGLWAGGVWFLSGGNPAGRGQTQKVQLFFFFCHARSVQTVPSHSGVNAASLTARPPGNPKKAQLVRLLPIFQLNRSLRRSNAAAHFPSTEIASALQCDLNAQVLLGVEGALGNCVFCLEPRSQRWVISLASWFCLGFICNLGCWEPNQSVRRGLENNLPHPSSPHLEEPPTPPPRLSPCCWD